MKICPKCGTEHSKPGKFCSRKCANSRTFSEETNRLKSKSAKKYWEPLLKTDPCKGGCGKFLYRNTYKSYCEDCLEAKKITKIIQPKVTKQTGIEHSRYLISSGEIHSHSEASIRRHMKRYLIDTLGSKCSICETDTWCDKPVPLVCDHIDGDSTNSSMSNFRLVCCNCDAQLDTFKSKNRGRGRSYDRERYQNLK